MIKAGKVKGALKFIIFTYFMYLLFSRFFYLHSDFPKDDIYSAYWSCNIEEKAGAYNARNKVLFGNWDSGGVNYQPMVMMPLSNLISFLSFSSIGVSLFSLRAPYALISVLAFIIFFLILKKEFGRLFALFGTFLFSSIHLITCLNRSATAENIFILLMVTGMFFYQKFLKIKQDVYLFLFGLFSTLNLSVKVSGVNFVLIALIYVFLTTAVNSELTFLRKKSILAKFLLGVLAGAAICLLLYLAFYMSGGLKSTWTMLSQGTFRFNIYMMIYGLINDVPKFFLSYAPMLTYLIVISLLFLALPFKNSLTKLDVFNLAWLILGILIILPFAVYYKRVIFLFPPVCYLITKTFYTFWQGCKKNNGVRLAYYVCFIIFAVMMASSIAMNESLNFRKIYFPKGGLSFESYNNSKDLGELLKPTTILGPESAFRILGFENQHKFLFRQDGSDIDGSLAKYGSDAKRQIHDILENKDIRYFCWSSTVVITEDCLEDIEMIKKVYKDVKLLRTYKFGPTYIELYDKYPNRI